MKVATALALGVFVAGCDQAYAGSNANFSMTTENQITLIAGHAILTAPNGMTLYTFDNDAANVSNCYDSCAASWPPYTAPNGAASPGDGFSIVERRDGTRQWAKNGAPLYFWVGDSAPGDTTGDGVGGVWHVAE